MSQLSPLRAVSRAEIMELEELMIALASCRHPDMKPGNTDSLAPVKHHFAPGLYAREIFLPAGLRIVGKLHKTSHMMTVVRGSGIIWNEFGAFEYGPGMTRVTRRGTKNVAWSREDSVIITYHPTKLTDVELIEREIIAPSYEVFDALECRQEELLS